MRFPDFAQRGRFWVTSAKLSARSGYQVRGGPYGSVSAKGRSDGTVKLQFAPEGREADTDSHLLRSLYSHQIH
ncbi:MAG TPA: hypothetical protein VK797_04430 [Tepidisphaeraceae bacterium]|jgi:hypothetical protein|nr:hypothetical protein [Tepidisphaeraceae bacterium]